MHQSERRYNECRSVYLLISTGKVCVSLVRLRSAWGGWRCIRVRDAVMNAEAVSKDYGGFIETESKRLPVNFCWKSPCVLSPVAFCMGGGGGDASE